MKFKRNPFILARSLAMPAVGLSAFFLLAGQASAASPYATWTNGVGDRAWEVAGNWTSPVLDEFGNPVLGDPPTDEFGNPILDGDGNPLPGAPLFESRVPTSGDKTNVWSAPGPIVSTTADTKELDVATTLDIGTGGDLVTSSWFIIAYAPADTATVTINDGAATVAGSQSLTVGRGGTGTLNLTNGSLTIANDLNIGGQHTNPDTTITKGTGFVTMDGATSTMTNAGFSIGRDGTGTLTIKDGSITCNNDNAWVGYNTGSAGTFNINGGTTSIIGGGKDLTLGRNGTGNLIMTDGSLTIPDDLIFGSTAAGDGKMTMSGGVVQLNDLKVGNNGKGELTMNGAVGGSIVGSGLLMIGDVAGSDGKLYMESGSITVGGIGYVGFNGAGLLDMTGGTINIALEKPLVIGRNDGSSGEVLLKGGTITAGSLEFTNGTQVAVLSQMDITDGKLVLSGNRVGMVNGSIDRGRMTTAYGGGCLLNVVYDSGTDLTTVTAGPASDGFEVWASGFGAVGRFGADDDGDGVSNGEEWAFYGTDPTVNQGHGSAIPDLAHTGPGTFTFTHLRPTALGGFTEAYEWSTTLQGSWFAPDASDGTYTVSFSVGTPVPDIPGYEKVTVTATASPATIPGFFARVKVIAD